MTPPPPLAPSARNFFEIYEINISSKEVVG